MGTIALPTNKQNHCLRYQAIVVPTDDSGFIQCYTEDGNTIRVQSLVEITPKDYGRRVVIEQLGCTEYLLLGFVHTKVTETKPTIIEECNSYQLKVKDRMVFNCGKGSLKVYANGTITLSGIHIKINSADEIEMKGSHISLN